MSLDIKTQRIERVIIECPMEEAKAAIEWRFTNGYTKMCGWSGPALNRDKNGPTYDETRYHTEGEKELP